jgi:hypothetical protein
MCRRSQRAQLQAQCVQPDETGSVALIIRRRFAFHRRDRWIVKRLWTLAAGHDDVALVKFEPNCRLNLKPQSALQARRQMNCRDHAPRAPATKFNGRKFKRHQTHVVA